MRIGRIIGCLGIAFAATAVHTACAAQTCRIERSAPLPITMENGHGVVRIGINGTPARFIVDTGSPYTTLTPAAAHRLRLPITTGPYGMYLSGFGGGMASTFLATVKTFTVFGYPVHNLRLLVAGSDFPGGVVGLLGENVLRLADFEYDFANGTLRMVIPRHCANRSLAYWAAGRPVSVIKLEPASETHRTDWIIGPVRIDGVRLRALFDTGAPYSILSRFAAGRLGLAPGSPGVEPAGAVSGIAGGVSKVWTAPIRSMRIGSERIEHTRMFVGGIERHGIDVILGADFFLSHHIYVANSQDKMYVTYNGGPVFNLSPPQLHRSAPLRRAAGSTGASAAQLMRRGMADAARHEYAQALAELDRACQLAPKDARYFYRRGTVYRSNGQDAAALADFNRAIALDGNDARAHLARAALLFDRAGRHGVLARIRTDLAAVNRLAPPEAELRLPLALLYDRAGQYRQAIREYGRWITYHLNDMRLPFAWSGRCLARAQLDRHLHRALRECDRALAHAPQLDLARLGRGLVELRLSEPRAAIADATAAISDYRAALRQRETSKHSTLLPESLYERGLAELRLGERRRGTADLRSAQAHDAGITAMFALWGLAPAGTHRIRAQRIPPAAGAGRTRHHAGQ